MLVPYLQVGPEMPSHAIPQSFNEISVVFPRVTGNAGNRYAYAWKQICRCVPLPNKPRCHYPSAPNTITHYLRRILHLF